MGVFAASAILLLLDAVRNPERWHAKDVSRWARASVGTGLATVAAIVGAALAGASGNTVSAIAAVGLSAFVVALRLVISAYANRVANR